MRYSCDENRTPPPQSLFMGSGRVFGSYGSSLYFQQVKLVGVFG